KIAGGQLKLRSVDSASMTTAYEKKWINIVIRKEACQDITGDTLTHYWSKLSIHMQAYQYSQSKNKQLITFGHSVFLKIINKERNAYMPENTHIIAFQKVVANF
ncbi:hypothetical protein ACJX0J_036271, partial [Zea mays]